METENTYSKIYNEYKKRILKKPIAEKKSDFNNLHKLLYPFKENVPDYSESLFIQMKITLKLKKDSAFDFVKNYVEEKTKRKLSLNKAIKKYASLNNVEIYGAPGNWIFNQFIAYDQDNSYIEKHNDYLIDRLYK